ncbi:MAG: LETM1 domain-containing protein [Flavobacteriales bacterium]
MSSLKNTLSPGSKNWIPKFFQLLEKGVISLDFDLIQNNEADLTHFISHRTGLVYGNAQQFLFSKQLDASKYTSDEKLKLLLFETLLFTYLRKNQGEFQPEVFLENLMDFYGNTKEGGVFAWFDRVFTGKDSLNIEEILEQRVLVKSNFFGANYWLNHLSNAFIFLDVVLYRAFLDGHIHSFSRHYTDYASSLMNGVIYAAYTDNNADDKEQRVLWHFLASTELEKSKKTRFENRILTGITLRVLKKEHVADKLLSKFTFELGLFLIQGTHQPSEGELKKLKSLGHALDLSDKEIQESREMCNTYMLQNQNEILVFQSDSETSYVFKAFSQRWIRILGRNKDKLVQEMRESKELMALIQKSTKEELSVEEKEQVRTQFLDLIKSMPSLALFLLPGGSLLLPLILKLVPELIPSAFKVNEIEKNKQKK